MGPNCTVDRFGGAADRLRGACDRRGEQQSEREPRSGTKGTATVGVVPHPEVPDWLAVNSVLLGANSYQTSAQCSDSTSASPLDSRSRVTEQASCAVVPGTRFSMEFMRPANSSSSAAVALNSRRCEATRNAVSDAVADPAYSASLPT